ncbi:MAG: hypothetical protein GEV07_30855 [Streptosporangiales bacterium]|nr:hypothetical protein [Streptosporangiales bacterium]
MNQTTVVIGHQLAARNLDRDGHPLLAAIHRLTPRQACDALAYLAGYTQRGTELAVDSAMAGESAVPTALGLTELGEAA